MHAANKRKIKILGATIIRFSGTNSAIEMFEPRQVVYITDSSDKLFLSREACTALGIITDSFPTIGDTKSDEGISQIFSVKTIFCIFQATGIPWTIQSMICI